MLEIITVLALLGGLLLAAFLLAALGMVFKVLFKIVLLPFWVLGFLLKALVVLVGVAIAIVLAPLLLVGLLVLLPLAVFGGLIGLGAWAFA